MSYLLALYLSFTDSWFSRTISKLYLIPRFIPTIVAVYAIMNVVKDTGALNRILLALFGVDFKPSLMYTQKGIILANCWFNIPFSTMLISASLQGIPRSIIESARDVGAGKLRVFFNMILPLSFNDFLIAITFVFMGNIAAFTTPYLMGARAPVMLGVALQQEFGSFQNHGEVRGDLRVPVPALLPDGRLLHLQEPQGQQVGRHGQVTTAERAQTPIGPHGRAPARPPGTT